MVGRRRDVQGDADASRVRKGEQEDAATRADVQVKGKSPEDRTSISSLSSLETSAEEQIGTYLSASSAGDTYSSEASRSTAPTSIMTDDDSIALRSPSSHACPSLTILEITSSTASSSALSEGFGINISRKGNFVSLYTSSNLWLIKAAQLPRLWARTLEIKRKPVAVDISEDGSLLAVLSRPSQVDLYGIHGEHSRQIRKRRTIMLVHEAHTMAMSPDGLILIVGNAFGIEVVSIGVGAPESKRRVLSGPVGDVLEFSDDSRTLLISGYARKAANSTMFVLPGLLDGPFNEEGNPMPASPESAWTGLVLFPETARIARQATLLHDADSGHVNELFAFNAEDDSWGIYDIGAQRFTQTKMFLPDQQRWTRAEFLDDAMPAISPDATLAAVALRLHDTTEIWLYQVPDWEYQSKPQKSSNIPIRPCLKIPIEQYGASRNLEIRVLRWLRLSDDVQRLIAVGNAAATPSEGEESNVPEGYDGVMIVLDFEKHKSASSARLVPVMIPYDLDPLSPGDPLPEGAVDFEQEVELVRTRTLAQRRAQDRAANSRRSSRTTAGPGRAHTTARGQSTSDVPPVPSIARSDSEELTFEEAQAAFEAPYDNTQPRSQNSLARAATVAAVSPANRRHLRALPFRPLEYRRADGMREFPHESDADNWEPPPPLYTATAEASQSVSLSHPNAPPLPGQPSVTSRASLAPAPPLSSTTNMSSSTHPYPRARAIQSHSSIDLTSASQRRLSLMHPSTFPSPPRPASGHRRSCTASTSQTIHQPAPLPPLPPLPLQAQSAYRATAASHGAATTTIRPTTRSRRAIESTIDLRPSPMVDPMLARRGSAPDGHVIARRPVPPNSRITMAGLPPVSWSQNQTLQQQHHHQSYIAPRQSEPQRPQSQHHQRRTMFLPRLTTSSHAPPDPASRSAPLLNSSTRGSRFPGDGRMRFSSYGRSAGRDIASRMSAHSNRVEQDSAGKERGSKCVIM